MRSLPSAPEIRLMTSMPLYKQYSGMNMTAINNDLHKYVREIAELESIPEGHLIDSFTEMGGKDQKRFELFCSGQGCDGCHPNDEGYSEIASIVYRNIFISDESKDKLL